MNARLYEAIGPLALATLVAGAAIVFAPDHRAVVAHVYVLVVGALLVEGYDANATRPSAS